MNIAISVWTKSAHEMILFPLNQGWSGFYFELFTFRHLVIHFVAIRCLVSVVTRHSIAWKYFFFVRFGISKVEMDPPLVTSIHLFCNLYVSPFFSKFEFIYFLNVSRRIAWNGHCDFESLNSFTIAFISTGFG